MVIKIILRILQYALLAFSHLFPRNRNIWCFGSVFNGNAKYLFIYMVNNLSEKYHCVWIGEKQDIGTTKSLGIESYYKWSIKGLYYSLIGGVYVYNSYPANINLYTMGGAKLVNLWHGVALKCIDRQIKDGPTAKYYQSRGIINKIRYLNFIKHADVVLSTSPIMTENFSEAFDVPSNKILEGVYPRCDLFNKKKNEIIAFISRYESVQTRNMANFIEKFDYTYVYMPTWRDTGDDFISHCDFNFGQVNDVLNKHNRLLLIKLHPDSKLKFDEQFSNIIIIDKDVDIYPLLPFTNCLITDFSSIYFDYLLMDEKQIILFLPDFDDYVRKNRALKYPYDDVMKGRKIMDFYSLLEVFNEENPFFVVPELEEIRDMFWAPKFNSMKQLVKGIETVIYN